MKNAFVFDAVRFNDNEEGLNVWYTINDNLIVILDGYDVQKSGTITGDVTLYKIYDETENVVGAVKINMVCELSITATIY